MARIQAIPYFAYGSNLNKKGFLFRAPDSLEIERAVLPDWKLTFRQVADIVPAEGREVEGALWWISAAGLKALDRYEGYPSLYDRQVVTVRAADGRDVKALTYTMLSRDVGLPSPSYYDSIERGFFDWGIDTAPLKAAVDELLVEHEELGVVGYRPSGPKRLEAIFDEVTEDFDLVRKAIERDPTSYWAKSAAEDLSVWGEEADWLIEEARQKLEADSDTGMSPATRALHELDDPRERVPVRIGVRV